MYWHIDADIISWVILLIVYVCNRAYPPHEKNSIRNKRFMRCLESGMVIAAVDIAASVIMEVPTHRLLYHILMTAYFVLIELVIVEWVLYILTILYQDDEDKRKRVSGVILAIYALYAAFCCSNPWTGLIYSLNENNEYARGPLFALMIVLFAGYVMMLFVMILIRSSHVSQEFPGAVLLLMPIVIAIGITVQLSIPGWLFIVPSYTICIVLAFFFLQTMRAKSSQRLVENLWAVAETDKLTGLYNRVGMEAMVQHTLDNSFGSGVVVLIADIDDLKIINDSLGHAQGDRAIIMVGAKLKQHLRSTDTVVRYGGDEFLAFFTGNFEGTQAEETIKDLMDALNGLYIGEFGDMPLRVSVGAAFGIVGKDTFESLCSKADIALYHVKRHGKNGHALFKPEMENLL